ncbi:hemerythrin domain-containing protein [Plantactinospora mayteni]|uniref:Hemerythrin n=1 Tax=Plantactinospora mayteni TaxID=566021 RepID=A0ABQ4EK51_9ACTN|nr:hemerythrin domain-containing protein [Plantactinospora mayteni]GIG95143.1 hemerythrin [Plantactinospora mayteni]
MSVPLPPLPPAGDDEDYRPGGRSMLELLAEEHDQIVALCAELAEDVGPERRSQVAEVLTATVARHLSGEEQYLYPTVRSALPDGGPLADREIAADTDTLRTLRELVHVRPTEPRFAALADEVTGQLRRHASTASTAIFPALRSAASDADLIRLGNRVEIAEEAAPTRPHPDAPATPPWNRVVEPALGVVDKVRDAVSGRPTYVEDLTPPTSPATPPAAP